MGLIIIGIEIGFGLLAGQDFHRAERARGAARADDANGELAAGKKGLDQNRLAELGKQAREDRLQSARLKILLAAVKPLPVPSAAGLAKSGKGRSTRRVSLVPHQSKVGRRQTRLANDDSSSLMQRETQHDGSENV